MKYHLFASPFCPKNQNSSCCDCFRSCIPQAITARQLLVSFLHQWQTAFLLDVSEQAWLRKPTQQGEAKATNAEALPTGQEHRNSVQHTPRSPCCTCQHKFFLVSYDTLLLKRPSYIMKLRETCCEKVLCLPSFILQTCTHISSKISSSIGSGNKIIDSSDDVSQ